MPSTHLHHPSVALTKHSPTLGEPNCDTGSGPPPACTPKAGPGSPGQILRQGACQSPHSNAHHSTKQPSPGWLPAHCCHLPRSKRLHAPLEPLSTRKKAVTSRRHFSKNLSGAQCRQTSPTDTHTSAWQDLALLLTCGCGRMPER